MLRKDRRDGVKASTVSISIKTLPYPIQICLNFFLSLVRKKVIVFCFLATFFICVYFYCIHSMLKNLKFH
jgi:hypothetical protein